MPPRLCQLCGTARAILKRPKTSQQVCKACFFYVFEEEIHRTIIQAKLFKPGDKVAIGASGGKGASWQRHDTLPNNLRLTNVLAGDTGRLDRTRTHHEGSK